MVMEEGPTIREQAEEFKLRTMELEDWLEDLCETFGNFGYNESITPQHVADMTAFLDAFEGQMGHVSETAARVQGTCKEARARIATWFQ